MRGGAAGRLAIVAVAVLTATATACGGSKSTNAQSSGTTTANPPSTPEVAVQIKNLPSGTSIPGNVVTLDLAVEGVTIKPADGDTSGRTGHFHVFLNRLGTTFGEIIPKDPNIIHTADNPVMVAGLSPGTHLISVVMGDGAHRAMTPHPAVTEVNVLGPTVEATAPVSVPAGQPVTVELKATGLTIVAADGDTSGKTGHFHLFVDRPPVAPGELIPTGDPAIIHTKETSVPLMGLAPGDHVVWVVVGDGAHKALDPPVRAKVTFSVT